MQISEIRRKTRVTTVMAWLVIPFILIYLASPISTESLKISYEAAYIITFITFIYVLTRTIIAFKSANQSVGIDIAFFAIDLSAMTFGVFVTGGEKSLFFNLYWGSILAGAMFFGFKGSLVIAASVTVLYSSSAYFSSLVFNGQGFEISQVIIRIYPLLLYTLMVAFIAREEQITVQEKIQAVKDLKDAEQKQKLLTESLAKTTLTERELEVLTFIAAGMNNNEIAQKIFVSEATVKKHVGSILQKLGLQNRIQAAVLAEKEGLTKIVN